MTSTIIIKIKSFKNTFFHKTEQKHIFNPFMGNKTKAKSKQKIHQKLRKKTNILTQKYEKNKELLCVLYEQFCICSLLKTEQNLIFNTFMANKTKRD